MEHDRARLEDTEWHGDDHGTGLEVALGGDDDRTIAGSVDACDDVAEAYIEPVRHRRDHLVVTVGKESIAAALVGTVIEIRR